MSKTPKKSNMWLVTVVLKGNPLQHILRFKTHKSAEKAIDELLTDGAMAFADDDYGTSICVVPAEIASVVLTDVAVGMTGVAAQEAVGQ